MFGGGLSFDILPEEGPKEFRPPIEKYLENGRVIRKKGEYLKEKQEWESLYGQMATASLKTARGKLTKGKHQYIGKTKTYKRHDHFHNTISTTINTLEEFSALGRRGYGLWRTYEGIKSTLGVSGNLNLKNRAKTRLLAKSIRQPVRQVRENIKELVKLKFLIPRDGNYSVIGQNGMSENHAAGSERVFFNAKYLKSQKGALTIMWALQNGYIHEQYLNTGRILQIRDVAPQHIRTAKYLHPETGRWRSVNAMLRNAVIMPWAKNGSNRRINQKTVIQDPQIRSSNWKATLLPRAASTHRGHIQRMDKTGYTKHVRVQMVVRFKSEQERDDAAQVIVGAINEHNAPFEFRGKSYGETMVYKGTCSYYIPTSYSPYKEKTFIEGKGYYLSFDVGSHVESNVVIKSSNLKSSARIEQNILFENTFAGMEKSSFKKTCLMYNINSAVAKKKLNTKIGELYLS